MTDIADTWYRVDKLSDDVSLITEIHVAEWLRCNIWHIRGDQRDLVIDSGMGLRPLKKEIAELSEKPVVYVSSHSHFDHMGGAHEFETRLAHRSEAEIHQSPTWDNTGAGPFIRTETLTALPYENYRFDEYRIQPAPLTGYVDEGDAIDLGNRHFQVLHLPGHSPGSIALWEEVTGTLFSGDVVYDGELFDGEDEIHRELYRAGLQRLREWPVNRVYGGHGPAFGRSKMVQIIDEYLAGSSVLPEDVDGWIESQIAAAV